MAAQQCCQKLNMSQGVYSRLWTCPSLAWFSQSISLFLIKKRQSHIIQQDCLVLKYVFYLFFALSSLCSTQLMYVNLLLSIPVFLELVFLDRILVDRFFSQQESVEFPCIYVCATEIRIQTSAFPVTWFMTVFFRKRIVTTLQCQRH